MSRPSDFDYWCPTCQLGFYSCSHEASDHDQNNPGHDVYDGGRMDLNGQPLGGVEPLYTAGKLEDYTTWVTPQS